MRHSRNWLVIWPRFCPTWDPEFESPYDIVYAIIAPGWVLGYCWIVKVPLLSGDCQAMLGRNYASLWLQPPRTVEDERFIILFPVCFKLLVVIAQSWPICVDPPCARRIAVNIEVVTRHSWGATRCRVSIVWLSPINYRVAHHVTLYYSTFRGFEIN